MQILQYRTIYFIVTCSTEEMYNSNLWHFQLLEALVSSFRDAVLCNTWYPFFDILEFSVFKTSLIHEKQFFQLRKIIQS